MAAQIILSPLFTVNGLNGQALTGGDIYLGEPNLNPETSPKTAYWDEDMTIVAQQPIRTNAGYPTRNGAPARIWTDGDYSILVKDAQGRQVFYIPFWSYASAENVAFLQAGADAISRGVQSKLREVEVSIADYEGADPSGVTDSSAAYASALAYANSVAFSGVGTGYAMGKVKLKFPAGDWRIDTGQSVANWRCEIVGDGREVTRIQMGSGQTFLTVTSSIDQGRLSGISFSGGAGALWYDFAGAVNVRGHVDVVENNFNDYTVCAIGCEADDFPYWKIKDNLFRGTVDSKGIALNGLNDQSEISNNSFLLNRYHIKLGFGGNNVKLFNNDFLRFQNGGGAPQLTDVWLVPGVSYLNSGAGFSSFSNKYGNENLNAADYRVLFADEGAGSDFFTKNHATTESVGYITGHTYDQDLVHGVNGQLYGFIYSYTQNVISAKILENWGGQKYPYQLEFDAVVGYDDSRINAQNLVEYVQVADGTSTPTPPWTNKPAAGQVLDPFGWLSGHDSNANFHAAGFDGGFNSLADPSLYAPGMLTSLATTSAIADSTSGPDAVEATYSNTFGAVYGGSASAVAGRLVWIEIDVMKSSSSPLTSIYLDVFSSAPEPLLRRFINLPTDWQTVRFPIVPSTTGVLSIQVKPGDYTGGKTKAKFGRIRPYNAAEPVNPGALFKQASAAWTPGLIGVGAMVSTTISVPGAEYGDLALGSFSLTTGDAAISAEARTDQVVVKLLNNTAAGITLGPGTATGRVYKK